MLLKPISACCEQVASRDNCSLAVAELEVSTLVPCQSLPRRQPFEHGWTLPFVDLAADIRAKQDFSDSYHSSQPQPAAHSLTICDAANIMSAICFKQFGCYLIKLIMGCILEVFKNVPQRRCDCLEGVSGLSDSFICNSNHSSTRMLFMAIAMLVRSLTWKSSPPIFRVATFGMTAAIPARVHLAIWNSSIRELFVPRLYDEAAVRHTDASSGVSTF